MSATGLDAARPESHRREIDGLRAVAVLAIVIFHAAPALLPGGYIGVDVFFVISGYLITRIIAGERDEGRFSFARFYLRRARRILPAYLLVTAVVAWLAYRLMLPDELEVFGWALASAALFLTNFVFAQGPGYFDPLAEQSPLLHLWSLSVEEQFYLVWPLLIMGLSLRSLRRWRIWIALALLVASLAAAQLLVAGEGARTAFFHLPFRTWEFLLGGMLALGLQPPRSRAMAEGATATGLILILGGAALLTPETPFPGLAALPGCLGAALAIWGGATLAAAPLRWPPMVWVGLISYSLYLWHWPLLVFARLLTQGPLGPLQTVGLVALSVALAALTWWFVEQPWRGAAPPARLRHLAYAALPLALLLALGVLSYSLGGLPQRLPFAVLHAAEEDINPQRDACFHASLRARRTPAACRPRAPVEVLVWGDSHADAITPGVREWAAVQGYAVQQSTAGGCPPLVDVRMSIVPGRPIHGCNPFNASVLREIAAASELKLIVLFARWSLYASALPEYDLNSPRVRMEDAKGAAGRVLPLDRALDRTLEAIAATGTKARVLVIGPTPELPFIPPRCIARKRMANLDERPCWSADSNLPLARSAMAEDDLDRALARHPETASFRPTRWLCHDGRCNAAHAGKLVYSDDDHLSASGARLLVPSWLDAALGTLD
jgi:peptidoglycan/LPS O-acetylase OafA/YrhL